MKNKIVRIVIVFCCLILLLCPLFTVGVSAVSYPPGVFSFIVTNPSNLSYSECMITYFTAQSETVVMGNQYIGDVGGIVIVETIDSVKNITVAGNTNQFYGSTDINDGVYYLIGAISVVSDIGVRGSVINNVPSGVIVGGNSAINVFVVDNNNVNIVLDENNILNHSYQSSYILYDLDISLNGGSSGTCPTLQEQLNSYTGTWDEFRGMLDQAEINGNPTLNEGLISELNEYREVGETSVKRELNSKTTFQQFIDQLTEYDMTNAIDVLNNHVLNVFNDGIDTGYAQGLEVGDEQGYNRGTSQNFGQNLLGETFNAPLNALNQWVLFETPGGIEVTMGGLFTAVIAIAVLVIFLKMFAGG